MPINKRFENSHLGAIRLHSLVLLVFGAGVLWFLFTVLRGGEHPLAGVPDLVVCDAIDESIWQTLPYAADGGTIRPPASAGGNTNFCAFELDPVPPGDRFARIARGEDADRVREIATVMILTRAALFRQSPATTTAAYTDAWSGEMKASGWPGQGLDGPCTRGELFTGSQGQQGVLIEDDGVMIWITAPDMDTDRLVGFAVEVAADLRKQP